MAASSWMAGKFDSASRVPSADVVHSIFRFYGTNAYWLQMTTDDDMDYTFHEIAKANFKVVRTWAFNDVPSKPSSGPYFQVLFDDIFFLFTSVLIHVKDSECRPGDYQRWPGWSTAARQTSCDRLQVWGQGSAYAYQQLESCEANGQQRLEPSQ
jgi:hypothetical protein